MRAHVIKDGLVVNIIEVESLDFMPGLIEATEGDIGWSYADGVFTAPQKTTTVPPEPTKEQLLAQLQALQAQIQVLE